MNLYSRDDIEKHPAGVAILLEAMGHPEALVTDLSTVGDFCSPFNSFKVQREFLLDLSYLMSRQVKWNELIYKLAAEIEEKL